MAYDAQRKVILLFGGSGFNDTWQWDGRAWTQLYPAQSPPPRTSASMAYDAQRGAMLLFGGVSVTGLPLGDTWQWDGRTWTQLLPAHAPAARCGAVMAFAQDRGSIVLFGGEALGGRIGQLLNDTWTWNGAQWKSLTEALAPPERVGATMAYDVQRQELVLFGGTAGSIVYGDTWTWSGQKWRQQSPSASPPARSWACMVYDTSYRQIVLLSGSGATSDPSQNGLHDMWRWNGSTWLYENAAAPAGGYYSAAYDSARHTLLVYTSVGGKAYPSSKQHPFASNIVVSTSQPQGETWLC